MGCPLCRACLHQSCRAGCGGRQPGRHLRGHAMLLFIKEQYRRGAALQATMSCNCRPCKFDVRTLPSASAAQCPGPIQTPNHRQAFNAYLAPKRARAGAWRGMPACWRHPGTAGAHDKRNLLLQASTIWHCRCCWSAWSWASVHPLFLAGASRLLRWGPHLRPCCTHYLVLAMYQVSAELALRARGIAVGTRADWGTCSQGVLSMDARPLQVAQCVIIVVQSR